MGDESPHDLLTLGLLKPRALTALAALGFFGLAAGCSAGDGNGLPLDAYADVESVTEELSLHPGSNAAPVGLSLW